MLPDVPEWKEAQLLAYEKESTGSTSPAIPRRVPGGHARYSTVTTETLETIPDGKEVTICGIIAGMKQKMTKKGDKMAVVEPGRPLGHRGGHRVPRTCTRRQANHMLLTDTPLIVAGQLDKSEQGYKIKALRLHLLADVKKKGTTRVDIKLERHRPHPGRPPESKRHPSFVTKATSPSTCASQTPRARSPSSVGREIRVILEQFISEIESVLGAGAVSLG